MAKITRKTQKTFGSSAGATGITEYGSPAGGTPAYSTDPDAIQTTEWETGWSAAALAGSEIPTFQDFNAIHYVQTLQLGYLLQEGVAEYDAGTEYHQNSIVKKSGTYELYGSKINTNTGNALPSGADNASWQYLGDLSDLAQVGSTTSFASDGYVQFGNGFVLQWGQKEDVATVGTFPLAFPTACLNMVAQHNGNDYSNSGSGISCEIISTTQYQIRSGTGINAGLFMFWIAIGH